MNITPLSEQEARDLRAPLKPGNYPFTVLSAEEGQSQNGNQMITLKLFIISPTGKEWKVMDWLLPSGTMAWRLRHFCKSVGRMAEYESGNLNTEGWKGVSGMAKVGNKIDDNGVTRLKIDDYIELPNTKSTGDVSCPQSGELHTVTTVDEPPF